ncbi:MAG: trypsin-like peptidase domain-containing protein [Chloroflexota bacterium]
MSDDLNSATAETTTWASRWQAVRRWVRELRPFLAGILAALLALLLYTTLYPAPTPPTTEEINSQVVSAMASATPPPPNATQVYQFILPSLVYIQTKQAGAEEDAGFGVGTGVIVNEGGDILTAYHVIDNASSIEVFFADGTQASAQVVGAEPENDIAILGAFGSPEVIVPAVLGSVGAMRIGDEAYAVGNPLGLVGSMSAGVISGFDRSIPTGEDSERLEGLIQFDAAVNPGNSGGPLLNRAGQVIGIVTAFVNPNNQDTFTGIGFAVPIGTADDAAGGPVQ